MNDKDKEAFNEWRNSTSIRLDIHDAWQAACEYKYKELMEWREAARSEAGEVNRLQAENKKLREALEYLNTITVLPEKVKPVIREALKEIKE